MPMATSEGSQSIALLRTVKPRDQVRPRSGELRSGGGRPLLAVHAFTTTLPSAPVATPGSLNDEAVVLADGRAVTRQCPRAGAPSAPAPPARHTPTSAAATANRRTAALRRRPGGRRVGDVRRLVAGV